MITKDQRVKLKKVWRAELSRCYNVNDTRYSDYGGRGIKVSNDFHSFNQWLEYVLSLENALKDGYSIDRINNDYGYFRGNIRWATSKEQIQNRRLRKDNKSGYKNVTFSKWANKWQSYIPFNGKRKYIGYFESPEQAVEALNEFIIENNLEDELQ